MVLHATGHLLAAQNGVAVGPKQLDQTKIGPTDFRTESVYIGAQQKIALRNLFQQAGVACAPGEEALRAGEFVRVVTDLAVRAGGPQPAPSAPGVPRLIEIRSMSGNEQLLALYEDRDSLKQAIDSWKKAGQRIAQRMPRWERLQELLRHADGLTVAGQVSPQAEAIRNERLLLQDPDPVPAICDQITNELRRAVSESAKKYRLEYEAQLSTLQQAAAWQQTGEPERARIFSELELSPPEEPKVGTEDQVLESLQRTSLVRWAERRDALQSRFGKALEAAAKLLTPKARRVTLPPATLSTAPEVDAWISAARAQLLKELASGPVIL